jgi:predicted ester cyclase
MSAAFPDALVNLEEVVAEGDKLAFRVMLTATHKGTFGRLEPTRKRIALSEVGILHFVNGKVVDCWAEDNAHEVLQQLSVK